MTQKELEITDKDWLEKVQAQRHITQEALNAIGVPLRYQDLDDRKDRKDPFTNILLVSMKDVGEHAKDILTDYVFAAMNNCMPGTSIVAITFQDLCHTLAPFNRDEQAKHRLYAADAVYIYDFGIFHLKDWEITVVGTFIMDRYNSLKHIALATENMEYGHIAKHVGPVIWQMVTDYCICRKV